MIIKIILNLIVSFEVRLFNKSEKVKINVSFMRGK